jgi:hypothetical protein
MKISFNSLSSTGMILAMAIVSCFAATTFAQQAPATIPGVLPAFITAGLPDPNGKVPVLNGIPGAGVVNLAEAMPTTVLNHGTVYVYVVALQDYNYTGTCVVKFKLTQVQNGKTVTLDAAKIKSFSCSPGSLWAWAINGKAVPNSPGVATLTGSVQYGAAASATKTTVVIQ